MVPQELQQNLQQFFSFRTQKYTGLKDAKLLAQQETEQTVLGQWMVLILVSTPNINVVLKIHFSVSSIQGCVAQILGKNTGNSSFDQVTDYMKEYANILAGGLKLIFEEQKWSCGISLPVLTRGFDHLFAERTHHLQWHCSYPAFPFYLTVEFSGNDPGIFKNFVIGTNAQTSGSNIEFL